MSISYEKFREEGWKCYHNDPAFPYDDTPNAKVISYFTKTVRAEEVDVRKAVVYKHKVNVDWLDKRLKHVMRYTKEWNAYNTYQCISLLNYLNEIKNGGYSAGILSDQEIAMLMPKDKKRKKNKGE